MNLRSVSATLALGALGLAAVAALGWLLLLGPVTGNISAVDEQRLQAQDRAVQMRTQLGALRRVAEDLPGLEREAGELSGIFPPTADQPGFFADVTKAADTAGIGPDDITTLSPSVPVLPSADDAPDPAAASAASQLAVQEVSIIADGTYDQLAAMLANLEEPRPGAAGHHRGGDLRRREPHPDPDRDDVRGLPARRRTAGRLVTGLGG